MQKNDRHNAGGKSAEEVREMFARVAPRYDFLNHFLSLGQDFRWRRAAARELKELENGAWIADVCAGTGDLGFAFLKAAAQAHVAAVDFTHEMLVLGTAKSAKRRNAGRVCFSRGDALHLPLREQSCAAAGVAFGIRNVTDLSAGLREMHRILVSGGTALILEFTKPPGRFFGPVYLFYFRHILPLLGRVVSWGSGDAYAYLPASVDAFAGPDEMAERMRSAGFIDVRARPLTFGVVHLYIGKKA